ncbi:HNH endonuclease [Mycobacterium phage ThulaThula]|uniref:HNH endonuclease n=1 Tax=Mycobacterium phage ThulaThula TaxID=2599880 RepID=A0A5J6TJS1_9CAUD|nr:HNH endonuclease [Mycobacterium phage ThulaThula]QFG09092.1 HNH endonuclease [Mycobacterium phage ThulaThula]
MMPIRPENRDRYPDDWPEISARIKFDRAGGRCECEGECGRGTHEGRCPNRHHRPAYGTGSRVVLTTAHLNHQPEDCRDDNLRAMCQGCHLHYDREHHKQTAAATRRATLDAQMQPLFYTPSGMDEFAAETTRNP